MHKLKTMAMFAALLAFASCQSKENESTESEAEREREGYAEGGEEEEDEKNFKFDAFEESITSKVNGLKVVQEKNKQVEFASNGARQLAYRVRKSDRARVYNVEVFETNGNDTTVHYTFAVDSLSGEVLNPSGK